MLFKIKEECDGRLLRDFLRNEAQVSRNTLSKLKSAENGILLNGTRVTVRAVLRKGDILELALDDSDSDKNPNVVPFGTMPDIIYEDDAIIAVNKPSGMPTHTSFGHYGDALSNALVGYYNAKGLPFVFRAINRLDMDTSGIVIIAKNRYFAGILSKALKNGEFEKEYLAIVDGRTDNSGKVEGYIAREDKSIIKRALLTEEAEGADYSFTEYKTLYATENASLVLARPITGRTHQIRLHMSSIGNDSDLFLIKKLFAEFVTRHSKAADVWIDVDGVVYEIESGKTLKIDKN